jgi:hypothetical protein
MSCAVPLRGLAASTAPLCDEACAGQLGKQEVLLPVLGRSVALLQLLLREPALDLELADCVITLDPGLAFGVLQLGNLRGHSRGDVTWQLPLALVASGRSALQDLLDSAPRLESAADPAVVPQLFELVRNAVVRGCLAHWLARELGRCNPKKAFLAGLLAEVPRMAALTGAGRGGGRPNDLPFFARLMSFDLAKVAGDHGRAQNLNQTLAAITRLAEMLRQKQAAEGAPTIADPPDWYPWLNLTTNDRLRLMDHGSDLARWAGENLYQLTPWDFISRLERHKPWT